MNLSTLMTETRNKKTMEFDEISLTEQLAIMNKQDQLVPLAIEKELPAIETVIRNVVENYNLGGRIIYCGAGTSGRIGVLDAVETLPTFGVDQDRFIPLLAGGIDNFGKAGEDAEDNAELGGQAVADLNLTPQDVVIGIAASGRTPYVVGALTEAKKKKAVTVAISCNKDSVIGSIAEYQIEVDCGPEVLTGSTRLKAGTAQKLILNMISTISMVRIGKTYSNLMVDVEATNEKLEARWYTLVKTVTNCSGARAKQLFIESDKSAKKAIVMELTGATLAEAEEKLNASGGFVKKAIACR